jgi:predicted O-methyltransferase YrrM
VLPPLVQRAFALAERLEFERSCSVEAGQLLRVLAGQRGRMRVGEIGTGCGVGAAWILSALAPETPFVTVELDPERQQRPPSSWQTTSRRACSTATGSTCFRARLPSTFSSPATAGGP